MEGGPASFPAMLQLKGAKLLIVHREKEVNLRETVFARVEVRLGPFDQMKLPAAYANGGRDEAYLDGLKWGKALMEEEIRFRHRLFNMSTHHPLGFIQ